MGINTEFEHPSQEKDDIVMVAKVVVAPIKTCVKGSYLKLCLLCNYFDYICPKLSL
jgi:hypothetical protein